MSAVVEKNGTVRQLDAPASPDEHFTEEQLAEKSRVARIIRGLLKDVSSLKRRWWPQSITFRDVPVDASGSTLHRFPHGFGGRVNWWPVGWTANFGWGPMLASDASSDDNTLVLLSYSAGTLSLRIEEAG